MASLLQRVGKQDEVHRPFGKQPIPTRGDQIGALTALHQWRDPTMCSAVSAMSATSSSVPFIRLPKRQIKAEA